MLSPNPPVDLSHPEICAGSFGAILWVLAQGGLLKQYGQYQMVIQMSGVHDTLYAAVEILHLTAGERGLQSCNQKRRSLHRNAIENK